MTKLSREDILKLARLSRLRLTDAEINEFQDEISEILEYVEMLKDVDVSGLDPTYQVTGLTNVARPDEIKDYGVSTSDLLANVPSKKDKYIKVKRVIG